MLKLKDYVSFHKLERLGFKYTEDVESCCFENAHPRYQKVIQVDKNNFARVVCYILLNNKTLHFEVSVLNLNPKKAVSETDKLYELASHKKEKEIVKLIQSGLFKEVEN